MDDDELHLRIVDGALGVGAPGFFGARIVGEDADDVELRRIGPVERAGIGDAAAEDEVELAHALRFLG